MNPLYKTGLATLIVSAAIAAPALAQDTTDNKPRSKSLSAGIGFADSSEPLRARVGLGIAASPDYEGSDDGSAKAFPVIDIEKPGVFFIKGASINTHNEVASAGLTLFHMSYTDESNNPSQLLVGPLIRAHQGRDEDDNEILNGLGDIDPSVGAGLFMRFNSGPWQFDLAAASQDVGNDNDGLLVTLDASYTTSINARLKLSSGLSTSWADDDYMQGYFGITNTQATNTGLSQFDSKAGMKDVGIHFKSTYALSRHWTLDGQIGYWRLLNDAADSPLVDVVGSANQVRGLVGLSYRF